MSHMEIEQHHTPRAVSKILVASNNIASPTRLDTSSNDSDEDEDADYIKRLSSVSLRNYVNEDESDPVSLSRNDFENPPNNEEEEEVQEEGKYMVDDEEQPQEEKKAEEEETEAETTEDDEKDAPLFIELDLDSSVEEQQATVFARAIRLFVRWNESDNRKFNQEELDELFSQWERVWVKNDSVQLLAYVKDIAAKEDMQMVSQMEAFSNMNNIMQVFLDDAGLWNETEKHFHYQKRIRSLYDRIRVVDSIVRANEMLNRPAQQGPVGMINPNADPNVNTPVEEGGVPIRPPSFGFGGVGGGGNNLFADPNTNRFPHNQGGIATPFAAKPTSHLLLLKHLQDMCAKLGYKKRGEYIYEEVKHKGYFTKAYRKVATIEEWLYQITIYQTSPELSYHRQKAAGNALRAAKDFEKDQETNAPRYQPCRYIWSFGNGRYNGRTDEFVPYDKVEPASWRHLDSVKFFPHDLRETGPLGPDLNYDKETHKYSDHLGNVMYIKDPKKTKYYYPDGVTVMYDEETKQGKRPADSFMKIKIPPLDPILKTQRFSYEQKKWIFGLSGRMTRNLGVENGGDNWQLWFYLFGIAGAGKSTMITAVTDMYHAEDILPLESSGETTFALPDPRDQYLWIIREVKNNWNISVDRFQLMVSGEEVICPQKNGKAVRHVFHLPGMGAGNDLVALPDNKGSIIRRIAMVEFAYAVKTSKLDTNLGSKLKSYMPDFIRKCSCAYNHLQKIVGDGDVWSKMPIEMLNNRETLKKNVDLIHGFVSKHCTQISWEEFKTKPWYITPFRDFVAYMSKINANNSRGASAAMRKRGGELLPDDTIIASLKSQGYRILSLNSAERVVSEVRGDDPDDVERDLEEKLDCEERELARSIKSFTYRDRAYGSQHKIICGLRINGENKKYSNEDNDEFYQSKVTFVELDEHGKHKECIEPPTVVEEEGGEENEQQQARHRERANQEEIERVWV